MDELSSINSCEKHVAIDLFCGCGGMTTGLKQAGLKVLWGVDIAEKPLRVYRANHPDVVVEEGDIRTVDCVELMRALSLRPGDLDLLAGCPPCQGFSSIRTRNRSHSIDDSRNDLIEEFVRFAAMLMPGAVMLENVPGVAYDSRFTSFCEDMQSLGYRGEWKVLDVADAGVPQRRKRLVYAAGRDVDIRVAELTVRRRTVRDAIEHLQKPGSSGDPMHDWPESRTDRIQRLISLIPRDGGSRSDLPDEYVLPCHKRNPDGFNDVYGRMAWDRLAPTITGGCASPSKGRFLHPDENRCITLREAALLQGFPHDYSFTSGVGVTKTDIALMIGNALPAPFIRAHAQEIMRQVQTGVGGPK